MEGEYFGKQDVVAPPLRVVKPREPSGWELSISRLAKAQAILWHETPINERLKVLARVDAEQAKEGQ